MIANSTKQTELVRLYVNTDYGNEVTADRSQEDITNSFGDISWRELLEQCLNVDLSRDGEDLQQCLDEYGIKQKDLHETIPPQIVDLHFDAIYYYHENVAGGGAKAFSLIRSLNVIPVNNDGSGELNGVILEQTTANGPRKTVYIDAPESATWLASEAAKQGVRLSIMFV
jgi:hypothetical protein